MTTDETTEQTKKIADLWQELGKEVGLDGLQLDENGACTLVFDGRVPVNSAIMEDAVVLHASLGVAPGARREAFLEMLLAANLFWLESDGATLSLEPISGEVLLARKLDSRELTVDGLREALDGFANAVDYWRERIAEFGRSAEAPEEDGLLSSNLRA
jgi:Tir chaperone protein (CesT) family